MAEDTPVTYEDLPDELKKKHDEIKATLEAELIGSFHRTRSHGVRWKGFTPEGALDGVDLSAPSEERTRSLRQEINYMVAHSLHRHSESLVNTLERVALRVVQEIMSHRYSPSGPALGTFKGEMPLQPQPFAWAAPELPNSSAYVVYKIGGDPSDYQFLPEAPKEIPHGYACAYVPDCNAWALSNQAAISGASGTAGGTSGADPEKQSWLAKYATPTNLQSPAPAVGLEPEKQAWLVKYATPANLQGSTPSAITADQICAILKDQFGMMPKRKTFGYTKPYPNDYELIPLPPKYRLPDFTKFSGSDGSSSIEHVSRYLAQLGTISASDELRRHPDVYQDKFKRAVTLVEADEDEGAMGDQEVAVAEWTRATGPVTCKWVKPRGPPKGFDFDVTKTEQIFDLLLTEKHIKILDTTLARMEMRAAALIAKIQRKPLHAIGSAKTASATSQRERVQRLRGLEEAERLYLHTLRKARPDLAAKVQRTLDEEGRPRKMEWRPKQRKADDETSAGTNMVLVLPTKLSAPRLHDALKVGDSKRTNMMKSEIGLVLSTGLNE
ncbi:hypothetical protein QYE76_014539 [Lolium multiflorum]|uniref:Uncharacterized protein n=1 Tax=Lolium multiflorum TaxID=4521 RepID=A0AAD8U4Z9_LOLMU|nr:hypothetical protein QYE76_014539 [Lolium multiflorum]